MSIKEINEAAPKANIQSVAIETDVKQKVAETDNNPKVEFSKQDISELISHVNDFVRSISTKVGFSYDVYNERLVVLVKDKETGEVIREIPPKEMLNLVKQFERVTGIIYHNRI